MEKCRRLEEYALFIGKVRMLLAEGNPLEAAINQAIDESVEQNVLKDVLIEQRAEVLGVLLSTFNKELYEKELKEDAFSQGVSQGAQTKLSELVQKKLAKGKSLEVIADELEESVEVIKKMVADIT